MRTRRVLTTSLYLTMESQRNTSASTAKDVQGVAVGRQPKSSKHAMKWIVRTVNLEHLRAGRSITDNG